jgi:hypothetical protein
MVGATLKDSITIKTKLNAEVTEILLLASTALVGMPVVREGRACGLVADLNVGEGLTRPNPTAATENSVSGKSAKRRRLRKRGGVDNMAVRERPG